MSAASNFLESALLEHFRGTQLPLPSGFYIALHTADPTDAGTGPTEVQASAWPAYARQTVGTPLSSAFTASSDEAGGGACSLFERRPERNSYHPTGFGF